MVALLVFIIATLEIWHKKTVGRKGPSGDNVFKNPARFKLSLLYRKIPIIAPPPPIISPPSLIYRPVYL